MPIRVPNNLPAVETLTKENVFVMTETRAMTQDIRPLQILILNLMPTKIDTETQLTRLLGNTPLQVELELLQTSSHESKNTSKEHMLTFYKTFDAIKHRYYDGMIITGAPVELMEFEEVEYWDELCEIMEWSKRHVHSTFHICWGAQAGLYYHYGIKKHILSDKLSGVYKHHLDYDKGMLLRGFDDVFYVPHSRNTTVNREDVEAVSSLKIIATSDEAGIYAIKSENDRQIFIMGHSEYDKDTLLKEYLRDKNAGLDPKVPCNYFPNDDDTKEPEVKWKSCANLIYSNWLNYFVYQATPYDINQINEISNADLIKNDNVALKVAKFGGTSLADADQFAKVKKVVESDETRKFVVVSAPGKRSKDDVKVTDLLIEYAANYKKETLDKVKLRFQEIVDQLGIDFDIEGEFAEISKSKEKAYIVSRGEYLNGKIMAAYLGVEFLDSKDFIVFDSKGEFLEDKTMSLIGIILSLKKGGVISGFYGAKEDGSIVTFSRGGSDLTGAILAAGLGADVYENWTDVSGLLMADPRIVDKPLTVPVITYKELRELAYMGAEVIHEDAVFPVKKLGIPINIRNTNRPEDSGTLIVRNADYYESDIAISGISGRRGYCSIVIEKDKLTENPQVSEDILKVFSNMEIQVEKVLSGIDNISVLVKTKQIEKAESELLKKLIYATSPDNINITKGISLIAIVGRTLGESPTMAVKVLEAISNKKININLIDHGAEKISLVIGVDDRDYEAAIKAIYRSFGKIKYLK